MNTKCWIFSRPDRPPATVEGVDDPLEDVLDDVAWGTEVVGETLDEDDDGAVVTVAADAHATTRKTSPTTIAAQVRERAATRPADLRPLAGAMGYPPTPLCSLLLISRPPIGRGMRHKDLPARSLCAGDPHPGTGARGISSRARAKENRTTPSLSCLLARPEHGRGPDWSSAPVASTQEYLGRKVNTWQAGRPRVGWAPNARYLRRRPRS